MDGKSHAGWWVRWDRWKNHQDMSFSILSLVRLFEVDEARRSRSRFFSGGFIEFTSDKSDPPIIAKLLAIMTKVRESIGCSVMSCGITWWKSANTTCLSRIEYYRLTAQGVQHVDVQFFNADML